jgi:hypothetical protein
MTGGPVSMASILSPRCCFREASCSIRSACIRCFLLLSNTPPAEKAAPRPYAPACATSQIRTTPVMTEAAVCSRATSRHSSRASSITQPRAPSPPPVIVHLLASPTPMSDPAYLCVLLRLTSEHRSTKLFSGVVVCMLFRDWIYLDFLHVLLGCGFTLGSFFRLWFYR